MEISWRYHGDIMEISWRYHGYIMDISWIYHGYIMDISWIYHGYIMDISWIYTILLPSSGQKIIGFVPRIAEVVPCGRRGLHPEGRWTTMTYPLVMSK